MSAAEIESAVLAFVRKRPASPADIARCLVGSVTARTFQDTGQFGALRRRNVSRDHVVNVIQRMIRQQRGVTIDRHLGVIPAAGAAVPAPTDGSLSAGQQRVLGLVTAGKSVFFTGAAGTGKSFLLRRAIEEQRSRLGAGAVFVTAATGIAACHIGGTTIHSFAGVGLAKGGAEAAAARVLRSRQAVARWRACQCLVVDEISMVDSALFEAVELVARRARRSSAPFGGVQVVLTGDFLQLPPVGLDEDGAGRRPASSRGGRGRGRGGGGDRGQGGRDGPVRYCFESPRWGECVGESVMLQAVFRQRDQAFVALLNALRSGRAGKEEQRALGRAGSGVAAAVARGEEPTRLFARNRDVDAMNATRLSSLAGELVELEAKDGGQEPFLSTLQRNCAAPGRLGLKLGAAVMLLKNLDVEAGLVNGATGRVVDFAESAEGAFGRVPKVEFRVGGGGDGEARTVTRAVEPESWTAELGGVPVAWRQQVPLKLAWALSIHKAQGMTLPLVDVSLAGVFAHGQAYVALSRAVALDRIRVRGFTPSCVKASARVLRFYAALPPADDGARPGAGQGAAVVPADRATAAELADEDEALLAALGEHEAESGVATAEPREARGEAAEGAAHSSLLVARRPFKRPRSLGQDAPAPGRPRAGSEEGTASAGAAAEDPGSDVVLLDEDDIAARALDGVDLSVFD